MEAGVATAEDGSASGGVLLGKLDFVPPSRSRLPELKRYAQLRQGESLSIAGYVEASRGCLHRCRHCPVVPVYNGRFRAVPREIVLRSGEDRAVLVYSGPDLAQHRAATSARTGTAGSTFASAKEMK